MLTVVLLSFVSCPSVGEKLGVFLLQVGSSDIDDVNIIAFRQINQFDLSGNVITASEYLSTLCVSSSLSSLSSVFVTAFTMIFFLQGHWKWFSSQSTHLIQIRTNSLMKMNLNSRLNEDCSVPDVLF